MVLRVKHYIVSLSDCICKVTKKFGINNNFRLKIWRLHKKSLSLQRESNRFTIQVSFLRGQAVYVTTHFIKAVQQSVRLCFLSKTIHHHFQEAFTQSNIAFNRYLSITTIYQYFLNICGYFKIVSDFLCQSTHAVIRLQNLSMNSLMQSVLRHLLH